MGTEVIGASGSFDAASLRVHSNGVMASRGIIHGEMVLHTLDTALESYNTSHTHHQADT